MHRGLTTRKLSARPSVIRVDFDKMEKKLCPDFYTVRKII